MSKGKTFAGGQNEMLVRIQNLAEPEIRAYVSSLKHRYGKDRMPLEKARSVIDDAMGHRTLTELLYETREQRTV